MLVKLPIENIEKINIYVNTGKKTLAQIKDETKADYIINGGFFDMSAFTSSFGLIADGKTIKELGEQYGFAFKGNQPIFSYKNNANADNYITAYPLLIRDGIKQIITTNVDNNSHRGRSAIGLTKDNQFVMCCVDDVTGYSDFTMTELVNELIDAECDVAINLDGGGSSQCDFNGQKITSTRIVHNYVCVYMKEDVKTETEENEVSKFKFCIDVGHEPTSVNGNIAYGYNEYDQMLVLGNLLAERMKDFPQIETIVVDNPHLVGSAELNEAIIEVNAIKPDLLISLHTNAPGDVNDTSANGFVAICYSKTSKGYTYAELLSLNAGDKFDDLYVRPIYINSTNYGIVSKTTCPAVIAEMGFHTNPSDVLRMINQKADWVEVIVQSTCEYFGVEYKAVETNEMTISEAMTIIQSATGFTDTTMQFLYNYRYGDDLLLKLAKVIDNKAI